MATITASWTENVTLHTSASLAAGATASDDLDIATEGYDLVVIQFRVTFGGSPDGDCDVEIFQSSDSGTTDDNDQPLVTFTIDRQTSTQVVVSKKVLDLPYIIVKLTNNDTTDNVTYEAKYAGREWNSA